METHQLRYFLAVTQTGRFTAAAKQCNVSQPSLSIQIAKLEDELGGSLFERTKKGVSLTSRGKMLLPRVKAIWAQMESVRKETEALSNLSLGSVTLGCLPTTGAHLLPKILMAFRKRYPSITVHLKEESSPGLAENLEQGEVELAMVDEAGLKPTLEHLILLKEELLLALPMDHVFSKRSSLSLGQMESEPFILMKPGHGFRQITLELFHKMGLAPRVVFESDGIETVQALVAAGLGFSLVPRMVAKVSKVAYIPLSEPRASRTLYLVWLKKSKLSPAAFALSRVIQETFQPEDKK